MYMLKKNKTLFLFDFKYISALLILIILSGVFCIASAEASPEFSARFRKLADELRCPTCQGLSVKDSEAGFSNSIKDKIRELMKEGKNDQEVMDYFVKRYGEWILRAPIKQGFNLLLWILPIAGILIGLFIVLFRSKRNANIANNDVPVQLTPEEERKVKDDLERFEEA